MSCERLSLETLSRVRKMTDDELVHYAGIHVSPSSTALIIVLIERLILYKERLEELNEKS